MDIVAGIEVDPTSDRIYFATDRTFSTSQYSLWALDVLTGSDVWSVNAGRIQAPPALGDDRIYFAKVTGGIVAAHDTATGAEIWAQTGLAAPFTIDPTVVELTTGETLIALPDLLGNIRVLRDDGSSATPLQWFQLPAGAAAGGAPPAVKATSRIVADASGKALVGANDGRLYPLDLVNGTVGTPIDVDTTPGITVDNVVLEPPGDLATRASVLVQTTLGYVARYRTTLGAAPPIPSLAPAGIAGLAMGLFCVGLAAMRRLARHRWAGRNTRRTRPLLVDGATGERITRRMHHLQVEAEFVAESVPEHQASNLRVWGSLLRD